MSDENIPDPREAEASEWSSRQWEQWFRDEVMSHSDWAALEARWDDSEQDFEASSYYDFSKGEDVYNVAVHNFARDPISGELDTDLLAGVNALAANMDKGIDLFAWFVRESWEHAFARISEDRRMRFFRGWNRIIARSGEAEAAGVAEGAMRSVATAAVANSPEGLPPDWERSQYWVNITLPNGNIATVPTGIGPSSPGAGDFADPGVTITEPNRNAVPPSAPPQPDPPANPPPSTPPAASDRSSFAPFGIAPFTTGCFTAVIGGLVALAVIAVLAMSLFGGDDDVAVPADADGTSGPDGAGSATAEPTSASGGSAGGGPSDVGVEIEVLVIDGQHYYRYMLDELASPASGRYTCGDDQYAVHLVEAHPVARSFENPDVGVPDPAPTGCGFGETITFTTNGRVVNPSTSALDPEFPRLRFTARVIGEWCRYILQDLEAAGTSNTAVENLCRRNPPQD